MWRVRTAEGSSPRAVRTRPFSFGQLSQNKPKQAQTRPDRRPGKGRHSIAPQPRSRPRGPKGERPWRLRAEPPAQPPRPARDALRRPRPRSAASCMRCSCVGAWRLGFLATAGGSRTRCRHARSGRQVAAQRRGGTPRLRARAGGEPAAPLRDAMPAPPPRRCEAYPGAPGWAGVGMAGSAM